MVRVLCVAEKPSVAKQIAVSLAQHYSTRKTKSQYCYVFSFNVNVGGENWDVKLTSVLGHLMEVEFERDYANWNNFDPRDLLHAKTILDTHPDMKDVASSLANLASQVDTLVIMTDCDREGEYIGHEIAVQCKKSNRNIVVKRCLFSALSRSELLSGLHNLVDINSGMVKAVSTRIEIDLRAGSSLTRYQTLKLGRSLPPKTVVSYGPCQFPTLGFIVEQYMKLVCFEPEQFWFLDIRTREIQCGLSWERVHLFDELFVACIYKKCIETRSAPTVKNIDSSEKRKLYLPTVLTIENHYLFALLNFKKQPVLYLSYHRIEL